MDFIGEEKKMTVREVAEAIGYEQETLRKKVKELFPDIVEIGKATLLNEMQVYTLKNSLLPRTPALKSRVQSAVTALDIEEMTIKVLQYHTAEAARLRAENVELKEQAAIAAPKAEFYDTVTQSADTLDFSAVAKVLNIPGMGRNKMLEPLRARGILRFNNEPYQPFVDRGLFKVVEVPIRRGTQIEIKPKTVVFQKGVDFIRKELAK